MPGTVVDDCILDIRGGTGYAIPETGAGVVSMKNSGVSSDAGRESVSILLVIVVFVPVVALV
jgi:hypothetical protein